MEYFISFGMGHESLVKQCLIYNLKGGQIPGESLQFIIPWSRVAVVLTGRYCPQDLGKGWQPGVVV